MVNKKAASKKLTPRKIGPPALTDAEVTRQLVSEYRTRELEVKFAAAALNGFLSNAKNSKLSMEPYLCAASVKYGIEMARRMNAWREEEEQDGD